jgi:hypothetical protein
LLWSCHKCKQLQCCEGVPVVIQYFDWKNGGLQSELIEVLQQSNRAAQTVAQKIKGTPNVFFIHKISGLLTICYFS